MFYYVFEVQWCKCLLISGICVVLVIIYNMVVNIDKVLCEQLIVQVGQYVYFVGVVDGYIGMEVFLEVEQIVFDYFVVGVGGSGFDEDCVDVAVDLFYYDQCGF